MTGRQRPNRAGRPAGLAGEAASKLPSQRAREGARQARAQGRNAVRASSGLANKGGLGAGPTRAAPRQGAVVWQRSAAQRAQRASVERVSGGRIAWHRRAVYRQRIGAPLTDGCGVGWYQQSPQTGVGLGGMSMGVARCTKGSEGGAAWAGQQEPRRASPALRLSRARAAGLARTHRLASKRALTSWPGRPGAHKLGREAPWLVRRLSSRHRRRKSRACRHCHMACRRACP